MAETLHFPPGFVWGRFTAADGAVLRWGHLPVAAPLAGAPSAGAAGRS